MAVIEYKKRRVRKIPPGWIIIIIAAIGIITFAFIWEAAQNRTGEFHGYTTDPSGEGLIPPPGIVSDIQLDLDALDWVKQDFLPLNEYSRPGTVLSEVNAIVIHYVGNPGTTAVQNRNFFAGLAKSGEDKLSSNFIVGLDGEILQCVPVDEVAYASNYRNDDTLSIETCHPDSTGEFNDATYASLIKLTAWLCDAYGLTENDVIRHYDITGKECPKYYVENEHAWQQLREDVAQQLTGDNLYVFR